MEKFNRAERRAQVARLKQKRKFYFGGGFDNETISGYNQHIPLEGRQLGRVVQYPAMCSCPMCGNSRRHFGERTIQEQRLMQDVGDDE